MQAHDRPIRIRTFLRVSEQPRIDVPVYLRDTDAPYIHPFDCRCTQCVGVVIGKPEVFPTWRSLLMSGWFWEVVAWASGVAAATFLIPWIARLWQ